MKPSTAAADSTKVAKPEVLEKVTVRFVGDSGDGIQVVGGQFTKATGIAGNDLSTFPDYPAEVRAPAGSLRGVSGFQIQFSTGGAHTPGDHPDMLVAFNPSALKVNLHDLPANASIIVNTDAFGEVDLRKAEYEKNPLEDGSLSKYQIFKVPITTLTIKALDAIKFPEKDRAFKERCKNFFALGMIYWLCDRPIEPTLKFIQDNYSKKRHGALLVEANQTVLKAGYAYAEAAELFRAQYKIPAGRYAPGHYRNIVGNEAAALGLVTAAQLAGIPLFYGSYPITPASEILQEVSKYKSHGVRTLQAEDEIAAICASIGAAYAGSLATTGTSGPGLALKSEALSLAMMVELPLVIVDVQRGGPSTGLPTKTEQADLLQSVYGRQSESPLCVVAPATPSECFDMCVFASRIAVKYMCPVIVLSDGYLANGSEPWRIPEPESLPKIEVKFRTDPQGFAPYLRDEKTLARDWAIPGTPGLEHRVGGLEKSHIHGNISYDPQNHDFMCRIRAAKIQRIVQDIPDVKVHGPEDARTLVLGWGSPYGAIRSAVEECQKRGFKIARAHLRHLFPFPANLGQVLSRFERVLIPEMNLGQLLMMVRAKYLVNAAGIHKLQGKPFKVEELVEAIERECR